MKNNTESPRKGTFSFMYVFLTFGNSAVYNINSNQVYYKHLKRNLQVFVVEIHAYHCFIGHQKDSSAENEKRDIIQKAAAAAALLILQIIKIRLMMQPNPFFPE
jgi:hypothetical protein